MTPRKSHWIFLVVGLGFICLMLAAPAAQATIQRGDPRTFQTPGDDRFIDPPQGGPTGTGGNDGGDPDDYSNLLREPNDPTLVPVSDVRDTRVDPKRQAVWSDPLFYAVLLWLGLER